MFGNYGMHSKFLDKQGQVRHVIKVVYIYMGLVLSCCARQALRLLRLKWGQQTARAQHVGLRPHEHIPLRGR